MSVEKEEVEIGVEKNALKKQSFFSRIKEKYLKKKKKKIDEIENQQLSEEEKKKIDEKFEVVEEEVKQSSGKKWKILKICFFVFNILLVAGILIWNVLTTPNFSPLNLLEIKYQYVLVVACFLILIIVLDVMTVHRMIYRKTMRSRWHLSYKSFAILRYYDAVTPMSSGGQSFMVTYLASRDIPTATALSIPIYKLVIQQISWLIVTSVCLILSFAMGMANSSVSPTSVIGFVIVCCMVALIMFVSLSKSFGQKLVSWIITALVKIRIVKDYEKTFEKVMRFVENYQNTIKEFSRSPSDVIYQIILHALRFVCLFSIPYFIYLIFPFTGEKAGTFGDFFIYTALIDLASSFIPLPGGTGMNEITFATLFKVYLEDNTFWALLLWRFCSYYFYLLQGLLVMTYDTVYGNRKYKWVKKRLSLQAESIEFKRKQIESFRSERDKRRRAKNKNR